MKILVLSNLYPPDFVGGYEICCRQTVDALRRRGHDVHVLTSAPRLPVPPEPGVVRAFRLTDIWSEYAFRQDVPVTAYLNFAESRAVNAFNVHALLDTLRTFEPDVVYMHMTVGLGCLGLLGALVHLKVPWVWQLGDQVPVMACQLSGTLQPTLAREYSRQVVGSYIAVSRQIADRIEAQGVALRDEVAILPNWIVDLPDRPRTRRYDGGTLRIVAASGQIERRTDKGIDLAIEAAALLKQSGRTDFMLDLYGNVADPFFPDLITKRGLAGHVTLKGSKPHAELLPLYDTYDAFLFPTRPGEPFGVAPLEAAARGCVPIISDVCGIAEWLVHGIHVLKAPRTAEAYASTLGAIMARRIDLEPLARRGAAVARREFHIDAIIPRIEAVLERASRRPRAGAGDPAEAYHLAVLAEKLTRALVQESHAA